MVKQFISVEGSMYLVLYEQELSRAAAELAAGDDVTQTAMRQCQLTSGIRLP